MVESDLGRAAGLRAQIHASPVSMVDNIMDSLRKSVPTGVIISHLLGVYVFCNLTLLWVWDFARDFFMRNMLSPVSRIYHAA